MDPFRTLQTVVSVWNGLKLKPLEWKHSGLMKTDVGLNMFMFFFSSPLFCHFYNHAYSVKDCNYVCKNVSDLGKL